MYLSTFPDYFLQKFFFPVLDTYMYFPYKICIHVDKLCIGFFVTDTYMYLLIFLLFLPIVIINNVFLFINGYKRVSTTSLRIHIYIQNGKNKKIKRYFHQSSRCFPPYNVLGYILVSIQCRCLLVPTANII
jgi:hypothetical protein